MVFLHLINNDMAELIETDRSKYSDKKPNFFLSLFGLRCTRCRRGPMFKNNTKLSFGKNMAMHTKCPVCGQYYELEPGFYYGTGYVSYALTVALTVLHLFLTMCLSALVSMITAFSFG